ncbi:MAG TPA: periplasmic heavy metal sensor [Longimicrobiales bacterium]|nr:periplasmic heavy metal sensor [Longimicrobiales bacterium]
MMSRHPTPVARPGAVPVGLAVALLCALGLPAAPLSAQAHQHGAHTSPYSDLLDREIKALSAEDVEGLTAGMGMQMALAAELNGYPGPRHVLDMADMLELGDEQRSDVQEIFDRMQTEARRLGAEIVEAERALDTAFADETIDPATLASLVGEIARARGDLRAVHLLAHLAVRPILTEEQRAHYDRARGYTGGAG